MGRIYAGVLGTLAMSVVLFRGALDAGGIEGTLNLAIAALVVGAVIGSILGHIAESTIDESVRYKLERQLEAGATAGKQGQTTAA